MDATALTRFVTLTLAPAALVLPPGAAAKAPEELRIGSVAIQSGRPETLAELAGRSYVAVDTARPIKPTRRYPIIVVFRSGLPEGAKPTLLLSNPDTGMTESMCTSEGFNGRGPLVYYDFDLRFPSSGWWSVAVEDGTGKIHEFADGTVVPTQGFRDGTVVSTPGPGSAAARPGGEAVHPSDPGLSARPTGAGDASQAGDSPGPLPLGLGALAAAVALGFLARRGRTPGLFLLAIALGGLVFPAGAGAKVGCEERARKARVEFEGLPARPEARRTYGVSVQLPSGPAANPRPLLFLLRCERREYEPGKHYLRDTDSAELPGRSAGGSGYSFDVRFRRPGRWLVASMDVSGRFRDFGFYGVRSTSNKPSREEGRALWPILIAGGGVTAMGGWAFVAWRRRSSSWDP